MKKLFMLTSLLFSIGLAGCAGNNNVNDDKVTYRDRNATNPTRVINRDTDRTGITDTNDQNRISTNLSDNKNYNRNGVRNFNNNNNTNNYNGVNNANLSDTRDNNKINDNNGRSRIQIADQVADKIAGMKEVDTANVIVTDNNAFVAAKLASGTKLTNKLESKISKKVKSVDGDIDRVYISANPNFYNRMRGYADDIRAGKPVSGFYNEFSQAIRRVFPDVK